MIQLIKEDNRDTNRKPGFHYVICLIEVWKPSGVFDFTYGSADVLRLTEMASMRCEDSYSQLLGSMELSFTKGTVIRRTIENQEESIKAYDNITINRAEGGVVQVLKNHVRNAEVTDFSPGCRIKVYASYTQEKEIADLGRIDLPVSKTIFGGDKSLLSKYKGALGEAVFDGYITKCSDKTPITLICESIASCLKKVSVKQKSSQDMSLTDIFSYINFTETTKIPFHESVTKEHLDSIHLPVSFNDSMNMLDVLSNYLKQYKLYAKIVWDAKINNYSLRLGYSFTSGKVEGSPCIYDSDKAHVIYSDYNVVSDGLHGEFVDLYYLVVKVHAVIIEDKGKRTQFSFCMRLDPSKINGSTPNSDFEIFNRKSLTKNDRQKLKKIGKADVDTSSFKVVDRYYPVPIKKSEFDELKLREWGAIQFYDAMKNGISGSLTLFGDCNLSSGSLICYVDIRYASRSGIFLVEKVETSLSTSGLRQEITIPYKISDSEETVAKILKRLEDERKTYRLTRKA